MNLTQAELEVALKRCEQEPVHQIGCIQSHGCSLVLGPAPERRILQASENLPAFFASGFEEALAGTLPDLIGVEQAGQVEAYIADRMAENAYGPSQPMRLCSLLSEGHLDLLAYGYASGPLVVLEVERSPTEIDSAGEDIVSGWAQHAIDALTRDTDFPKFFATAARLVQEVFGFDRVMVYQFDPNWEGEVIAEARNERLPSYLGNRFPASDIPPQARKLYTVNRIRLVSDIDAATVAILPAINPLTNQALDMSHSWLRGFSPIHIEYLRNMDVRSSLSLSLLMNGRLWGLIACHGKEPYFLGQRVYQSLDLLSRLVSMWLSALESRDQEIVGARLGRLLSRIMRSLSHQEASQVLVEEVLDEMLGLMKASGVLLINCGNILPLGQTPPSEAIDGLLAWLRTQPPADVFQTDQLAALYPPAAQFADVASGLLVVPFSPELKNAVLWFRPERLKEVRWAGSPEKTVTKTRDEGLRVSPRTSFASWTETWHGRSVFWNERDILLGETLSLAFVLARARRDDLTGLPTRAAFDNRIRQAIARAGRNGARLALAFIDLDKFKPINDRYGHAVGDHILHNVAERLKSNLRIEDTLARWGGDEFVLLFEDVPDLAACVNSLERIRCSLEAPFTSNGVEHHVSACIGLALFPVHAHDAESLVRIADDAMYRTKQHGGNRIEVCG